MPTKKKVPKVVQVVPVPDLDNLRESYASALREVDSLNARLRDSEAAREQSGKELDQYRSCYETEKRTSKELREMLFKSEGAQQRDATTISQEFERTLKREREKIARLEAQVGKWEGRCDMLVEWVAEERNP